MADFLTAYNRTARNEGGYQCNPNDNGNWTGGKKDVGHLVGTNYGITAPDLMAHLGRVPTADDMKNISLDLVEHIYRNEYWNIVRGDMIQSQDAANQIYDSAVNMGTGTAIILAQRALGLPETGRMDAITLNALNHTP